MAPLQGIAVNGWYRSRPPQVDEAYKRFIRMLPCAVCCAIRFIETAHFGPRGLGQKTDDRQTLPLCRKCHRTGEQSYHRLGPVRFARIHRIHPPALILKLNQFYDERGTPDGQTTLPLKLAG